MRFIGDVSWAADAGHMSQGRWTYIACKGRRWCVIPLPVLGIAGYAIVHNDLGPAIAALLFGSVVQTQPVLAGLRLAIEALCDEDVLLNILGKLSDGRDGS